MLPMSPSAPPPPPPPAGAGPVLGAIPQVPSASTSALPSASPSPAKAPVVAYPRPPPSNPLLQQQHQHHQNHQQAPPPPQQQQQHQLYPGISSQQMQSQMIRPQQPLTPLQQQTSLQHHHQQMAFRGPGPQLLHHNIPMNAPNPPNLQPQQQQHLPSPLTQPYPPRPHFPPHSVGPHGSTSPALHGSPAPASGSFPYRFPSGASSSSAASPARPGSMPATPLHQRPAYVRPPPVGGFPSSATPPGRSPSMTSSTVSSSSASRPVAAPAVPQLPKLASYANTYASRLKEGMSALLVPTGPVGKRKRAAATASASAIADMADESDDSDLSEDGLRRRRRRDLDPRQSNNGLTGATGASGRPPAAEPRPPAKRAFKRTKHSNLLPRDLDYLANCGESLVPIRLDLDIEGYKVKDTFMWNLREKSLNPQKFAEIMCEDLDLPASLYAAQIAESITTQVDEHLTQLLNEVPPEEDMRISISLDIIFGSYSIRDRFEWDLASRLTPEEFAEILASDLGLGGEFAGLVAHSIHEQIQRGKAVISAGGLDEIDADGGVLGMLKDSTRAIEDVLRDVKDVYDWGPIIETISREQVERIALAIDKERGRRNRTGRGNALSRRRSYMPADLELTLMVEPEETWATAEDRNNWKCAHCQCKGKQTTMPRKGPTGLRTLCNSCGLFFKSRGELPAHRYSLFA
ncbi:hypothetical protein DFJ73DRAFT_856788 [Zopfochytrium polystomum]|nr:hypothetical protein DFJ73DRAFT_856788 [Zopfochytrium polystomum]